MWNTYQQKLSLGLYNSQKIHEFVYIARQYVYTQINYRTRIDYVGMWNIITFCYPLGLTNH